MLTDIFAYRYADVSMWDAFEERDRRFIVQAWRIVVEQLFPPYINGKKNDAMEAKWKIIHDRLSTEIGLNELSPRAYSYPTQYAGKSYTQSGTWSWDYVCKQYVCKDYNPSWDADTFVKNRLSFVEVAFREREQDIATRNAELPKTILDWKRQLAHKGTVRSEDTAWITDANTTLNDNFRSAVHELNTRLRQARYVLNYHNGYIQISKDEKIETEIESPFWALVIDPKWKNVETDMAEAIDRRDTGGRDPAWYAARALESTIKVISGEKGWTHGGEKGAQSYIDNLGSKKNGQFIDAWERTSLKQFFGDVRADFSHGPGADPMPKLSDQQTNWAIEFCMSWIKSLIERA